MAENDHMDYMKGSFLLREGNGISSVQLKKEVGLCLGIACHASLQGSNDGIFQFFNLLQTKTGNPL